MNEWLAGFLAELEEVRQQVESGEVDSASVRVAGEEVRMERAEDGSFRYSTPRSAEGVNATTWPASPTRPDAYPNDLPFLPNLRTSIVQFVGKGRRTVSWPNTGDQQGLVAAIDRELGGQGWVRTGEHGVLLGLVGREVTFERDGARCTLWVHQLPGRDAKVRLIVDRSTGEAWEDTA